MMELGYRVEPRESAPNSVRSVAQVWEWLLTRGFAVVADTELDFDPGFIPYANQTYFDEERKILQPERPDIYPPNRRRADGIAEVCFNSEGEISLRDIPPLPLENEDRGQRIEARKYFHTEFMGDNYFRHWLATLSGLIPPRAVDIPGVRLDDEGRFDPNALFDQYGGIRPYGKIEVAMPNLPSDLEHTEGRMWQLPPFTTSTEPVSPWNVQFYEALTGDLAESADSRLLRKVTCPGIFIARQHLFETRENIVSGPHRDNVPGYITTTVVEREGEEGGVSQIFEPGSSTPCFEILLQPGQTLILDDTRYQHSVTPMPAGRRRRTIICSFSDKKA